MNNFYKYLLGAVVSWILILGLFEYGKFLIREDSQLKIENSSQLRNYWPYQAYISCNDLQELKSGKILTHYLKNLNDYRNDIERFTRLKELKLCNPELELPIDSVVNKLDYKDFVRNATLGVVYSLQNKFDESIKIFEELVENDISYFESKSSLSEIYRMSGDLSKSEEIILECLKEKPGDSYSNAVMAMIQADKGEIELFLKYCEVALQCENPYPFKNRLRSKKTLIRMEDNLKFRNMILLD